MEQLVKEESTFLSLCSPHDRDLLTGRIDMTLQDFERITYLTMALDYVEYSLDPVSYTHLDVYKRQVQRTTTGAVVLPLSLQA